ncbi:hypothetical protein [Burkholderia cenocepacia]|uniref:hypothetical protein n=1 Tax=Burkholderia cenocepacia TaxID=95486 RepID=UPI0008462F80|nr:hypothetical protein [Burkholderia cenocepacia]
MLNPYPITPASLPGALEAHEDRARDEEEMRREAEEAAIERASDEVDFNHVLDGMATLPKRFTSQVMSAYLDKSDRAHFKYLLELLFDDAFAAAAEGIAKRKGY